MLIWNTITNENNIGWWIEFLHYEAFILILKQFIPENSYLQIRNYIINILQFRNAVGKSTMEKEISKADGYWTNIVTKKTKAVASKIIKICVYSRRLYIYYNIKGGLAEILISLNE